MQLRNKNVFDLGEVEFAVLEANGKLSVQKKSQNLPLTPKDMKLSTDYKGVSTEIIRDGKIEDENLKQNMLTHEWLYNQLAEQNVSNIEDVFLATLSTDGSLYLDLRDDTMPYKQVIEDEDSIIK